MRIYHIGASKMILVLCNLSLVLFVRTIRLMERGFFVFFFHTLTFFLQWAVNIFFDLKVNVLKLTKLIQNLSEKQELIKPIAYCHKMFLSSTVFNVINM